MMLRFLVISLWTFTLGGCALGPDYERPPVEEPGSFRMQQGATLEDVSLADLGWWELFEDENLQAIIRKALVENKDLRIAVARVRESRAHLVGNRCRSISTDRRQEQYSAESNVSGRGSAVRFSR